MPPLPNDDVGSGPAVALLHAGVADRRMWSEHLEPLADAGHRVVAVDITGFGEAALPEGEDAPWRDVVDTMDALAIDRAALVGVSYGAGVALRVAFVAPERVSALVLVSASVPGAEPSAELQAAWDAESAALERGDVDGAVRAVVEAWTLPEASAEVRERIATMQRRAFELQADTSRVVEAPDPLANDVGRLADVRARTLLVVGDRDKVDYREGAGVLAGTLPDARVVVVEDAAHLVPLEAQERFRELVVDFVG